MSLAHSKQVVECSKSSQLVDRYRVENKRQEQQLTALGTCYQKNQTGLSSKQREIDRLNRLLEESNEKFRTLDDFQDALEQ